MWRVGRGELLILAKRGWFRVGMATYSVSVLNVGCGAAFLPWHGMREAALPLRGSAAWEYAVVFSRKHRTSWEEVMSNTPLITPRHF